VQSAKTRVVYVACETVRKPNGVGIFVKARGKGADEVRGEVLRVLGGDGGGGSGLPIAIFLGRIATNNAIETLLIIDALNPLSHTHLTSLPPLLSALLSHPRTSLLSTYHTDIPPPTTTPNPYAPSPSTLLAYLATTLLTTHSIAHVLSQKSAIDHSAPPPAFGLEEGIEGILVGLGSNDQRGVVIEMEYRRRSGRGVGEWYFLPAEGHPLDVGKGTMLPGGKEERAILLVDHPLYKNIPDSTGNDDIPNSESSITATTFNLTLTDKQRKAREEVVLPYYDAQNEGGVGEGGRILYEMGWEDDFDEEEDEV
jgi:elongator complex protein 5